MLVRVSSHIRDAATDWVRLELSKGLAGVWRVRGGWHREPAMRSGPVGSTLLASELVDEVYLSRVSTTFKGNVLSRTTTGSLLRSKLMICGAIACSKRGIMIIIMGTIGRCCVVPVSVGKSLSSKHVWRLTLDSERYMPELACVQMNCSPWGLAHFRRDEQGGIMSAIRSETLRSRCLPTPPMAEQQEIWAKLDEATTRIGSETEFLCKLRATRFGLASDLLSGRVRTVAA